MNLIHLQLRSLLTALTLGVAPLLSSAATFSREGAVQAAFDNNPTLRAAELEIARAEARLRGSGRLANPEIELSLNSDEFGNNEGEGDLGFAITQQFPITSRLRHEKALATVEVQQAIAEFVGVRLEIAREVERLALEVLQASHQIALSNAQAEVQSEIANFLTERAATGEASSLKATEPRLAARMLEQGARMLTLKQKSAIAELRPLIGISPDQDLRITGDLSLPKSNTAHAGDIANAVSRRPEFRLATLRADAADAGVLLARDKRWDDIAVSLFAEHEHIVNEPTGNVSNDLIGIAVSIPLPLWNDNRAGVDEAQISRQQAGLQGESIALQIRAEITAAAELAALAHELATEAGGVPVELAEENLNAIREAQVNGQATSTDVQRALAQKLELEESRLDLLITYHEALADLRHARADYPGLWNGIGQTAASSTSTKNPRK